MSYNALAKTVSTSALTSDGDRLTLAAPTPPMQLPHSEGGYVVLVKQNALASGGCKVTKAEVVKYSGYEDDGKTLIITERGLEGTAIEEWAAGALVQQPLVASELNDYLNELKALIASGETYFVTPPNITPLNTPIAGTVLQLAVSGGVSAYGVGIDHYEVTLPDNTVVNGSTINYSIPADATIGDDLVFSVVAVDSTAYENKSQATELTLQTVENQTPNTSNMTDTFPSGVSASMVFEFAVSGAIDPEGGGIHYKLANADGVSFNKTDNIADNEVIVATVADNALDGTSIFVDIIAVDADGFESSPKHVLALVSNNIAPVITGVSSTFPSVVNAGQSVDFELSGGSDADGDPLVYQILNPNGLSFNKTSNIATGGTVTASINAALQHGDTVSFDVFVSDGKEFSLGKVVVTANVEARDPDVSGLSNTLPAYVTHCQEFSFVINGATDPEGRALTHTLSANGLTFANNGVANGEVINATADCVLDISQDLIISVETSNGHKTVTTEITLDVDNKAPVITNMTDSFPASLRPDEVVTFAITGAVDPEGKTVTYTIADAVGVSFSKTSGIVENEVVTVTTTGGAATTAEFNIIATDGMFNAAPKAVSAGIINTAPDVSSIANTLPDNVLIGDSYEFSISGATDVDGDSLTYSITSVSGASVDKSSGIIANETINLTINAALQHDDTVTINGLVIDQHGKSTPFSITTTAKLKAPLVNNLSILFNDSATAPTLHPCESMTLKFADATDPQGLPITYAVASVEGLTFSKTANIAGGEEITATLACVFDTTNNTGFSVIASNGHVSSDQFYQAVTAEALHGSKVFSANDSVTVGPGVSTIKSRGHGSAGTYTASYQVQTGTNRYCSFPSSGTDCLGITPTLFYNVWVCDCPGHSGQLSEIPIYTTYPAVSTAGEVATLSGAISASFAGAASGVTTAPPTSAWQVHQLDPTVAHTINAVVPNGALAELEW